MMLNGYMGREAVIRRFWAYGDVALAPVRIAIIEMNSHQG